MKFLVISVLLSFNLGACRVFEGVFGKKSKSRSEEAQSGRTGPAVGPLKLQSFASCAEADTYLRDYYRKKLTEELDQERRYLESAENRRQVSSPDINDNISTEVKSTSQDTGSGAAPQDFTTTNIQVAGVDEPDIMKNTGTHIYSISGRNIEIVASWPAASMQKIGRIAIKGSPVGLMLTANDLLLVVYHPELSGMSDPYFPGGSSPAPWMDYAYSADYQVTRLAFYKVNQPANPQLLKEMSFLGNYLTMRRQDNQLRLIQSDSYLAYPEGLEFMVPLFFDEQGQTINLEQWDRARAELEARNEARLASLSLSQILGQWRGQRAAEQFDDPILSAAPDCQKIFAEAGKNELGFSKLTSIDLNTFELNQVALMAPANQVYASGQSLYLAHSYRSWWWGWDFDQGSKTYLHKFQFDSAEATKLNYLGSGLLDGYILNQFALDEYEDHLRVAVTDDRTVSSVEASSGRPTFTTSNRIEVMAIQDGELKTVGKTENLAKGEQIFAVRFHKDKGYLVTFRQTDPLYTLDLSNATAPKVVGELKIPGFSNYLHMLGDHHLLAVGRDADPSNGQVRGLKISVFDVSNLQQPREAHSYLVGNSGFAWSEAQYDHRAFNYFASQGLLGIPVGGYRQGVNSGRWWGAYFSELMVFKIDLAKGIEPRGSIGMNDLYQGQPSEFGEWWTGATVQRSVFADDFIYAVSGQGIKAVQNQDLRSELGVVRFYP